MRFIEAAIPVESAIIGHGESDFLFLSDEMKSFLDSHIIKVMGQKERLYALIDSIFSRSSLNFEYSNNRTYTASESFKNRSGNCLSYTAMFVVMARYIGIEAHFQEVYDFSTWSKRGDLMVFNLHMNALVEVEGRRYEVDFDLSRERKLRHTKLVSDLRAQAHYFNNVGAEALVSKNYDWAESLFRKAIGLDPKFSPPHTNLGLLFQYRNQLALAETLFKKAFQLDKHDYTAQVNLARLYKTQGRMKEAEKLLKHIQNHYKKNPFYHYSLGQEGFLNTKYKFAVRCFKRAIRLSPKEPEFYARLAAAYFKLKKFKAVEKYLKRARKLAVSSTQRSLYGRKLNYLYAFTNIEQ